MNMKSEAISNEMDEKLNEIINECFNETRELLLNEQANSSLVPIVDYDLVANSRIKLNILLPESAKLKYKNNGIPKANKSISAKGNKKSKKCPKIIDIINIDDEQEVNGKDTLQKEDLKANNCEKIVENGKKRKRRRHADEEIATRNNGDVTNRSLRKNSAKEANSKVKSQPNKAIEANKISTFKHRMRVRTEKSKISKMKMRLRERKHVEYVGKDNMSNNKDNKTAQPSQKSFNKTDNSSTSKKNGEKSLTNKLDISNIDKTPNKLNGMSEESRNNTNLLPTNGMQPNIHVSTPIIKGKELQIKLNRLIDDVLEEFSSEKDDTKHCDNKDTGDNDNSDLFNCSTLNLSRTETKILTNLKIKIDFRVCELHKLTTFLNKSAETYANELIGNKKVKIKFGALSAIESNVIKRNWSKFRRIHAVPNKPYIFTNFKEHIELNSKCIRFLQFIGQGLKDRTLGQIYANFQNIYKRLRCR